MKCLLFSLGSLATLALSPQACAARVDFNSEIRPILSEKCYSCHGPDDGSRKAKLRLDLRPEAVKDRDGIRAIVPGDVKASELVVRILSTDPDEVMPPPKEHHELTEAERGKLQAWIAEGAEYAPHWAFQPPQAVEGTIDGLVSARLAKEGLNLSPEADSATLLRRVSLDLTGLPPTPEEARAFLSNPSPAAYEQVVDRLLASPAYGERWARMWLDLARYADSTGYGSDAFRLNIWPWRDWVIDAFNRNLPYDQFTIEQLAGDLLPDATPAQITATAFHRNTMTNTEGGTDDEEWRVAAVKDRVATTMQVWMGLTAQCAQCHTHKFDPISHREYYGLFAIFNQTEDADRNDEAPKMPVPTAQEAEQRARLTAEIAALEQQLKTVTPELEAEQHEWEAQMLTPVRWEPLQILEARSTAGALKQEPDGTLLAPAASKPVETFTIQTTSGQKGITAIRVEVLPEAPGQGVGRANGNAVLTEFEANLLPIGGAIPRGRFVRIEHQPRALLQIAEVEVFSAGRNLARAGQAKQSSTYADAAAARAIDGRTSGRYIEGSVAHTGDSDPTPWWEVDLGSEQPVEKILFWNRAEEPDRIRGARLILLDAARQPVFTTTLKHEGSLRSELDPSGGARIAIAHASAEFAQEGFPVAAALDGNPKTGWAFAPAAQSAHSAVFELQAPVTLDPSTALALTLRQDYGGGHHLARLRLSATSTPPPVRQLPQAIANALAIEPTERSPEQRSAVREYFLPLAKSTAALKTQLTARQAELAKIKSIEVPIMRERTAAQRRKTWILNKGNYLQHGEEVQASLLETFAPQQPAEVNRLALARWLVARENPLTARVAVNRFWAQLFGTGLVETEEDFGTQGQLPTHPELLDTLAVSFMENGWDMKALLKQIVLSATYRQSSVVPPEAAQKDPRNRLLSHYPRRRLEAEGVRDQALQVAGLLSRKIGGPSVYPPQPPGLWNVAFNGGQNTYPTSTGPDRYRRGLYTFWRRTMPNPTMTTFDAPSRETCTLRRSPTNTPLQAFVTLNDPVFVEAAQALARRILQEGGSDNAARLPWALQLVLVRPPSAVEVSTLQALLDETLADLQKDPASAQKLATEPLGPLPPGIDPVEAAAWTALANVLLNLDAVLTRS